MKRNGIGILIKSYQQKVHMKSSIVDIMYAYARSNFMNPYADNIYSCNSDKQVRSRSPSNYSDISRQYTTQVNN
jgi:hypothetical protein